MITDIYLNSDRTTASAVEASAQSSSGGTASAMVLSALTLVSCLTGTSAQPPLRDISALSSWSTPMRTSRAEISTDLQLDTAPAELPETRSDRDEVVWVKERSGLTWEQLGRIFGVSRRSVHFWANGGRMNEANAAHLREFAAVVRELDTGDPTGTRARLLAVTDGLSVVDRFRRHQTEGLRWGAPFAPEELVGAIHDEAPEEL